MRHRLLLLLVASLPIGLAGCDPPGPPDPTPIGAANSIGPASTLAAGSPRTRVRDESDAFFDDVSIPELRIEIAPAEADKLRAENRSYVECTLVEQGGEPIERVGIKLKGAAGSFRDLDDRPALT